MVGAALPGWLLCTHLGGDLLQLQQRQAGKRGLSMGVAVWFPSRQASVILFSPLYFLQKDYEVTPNSQNASPTHIQTRG